MNNKFDEICENGVCGDVKQFEFDHELCEFIGENDLTPYDTKIVVDGVTYYAHWLFFNIAHESAVYGVLYNDYTGEHDVIFGVVGCKLDTKNNGIVDSFDDIYRILTDKTYFVD